MNRKTLIDALRADGYAGDPDLAQIKKHLEATGRDSTEIETPDGKMKLDDVWAKAATLSLAVEDEQAEETAVETKKPAKAKAGSGYEHIASVHVSEGKRDRSLKRYEQKIARKNAGLRTDAAVFDSPEDAEAFSAMCRTRFAKDMNTDYAGFGSDMDTLKRFSRKTGITFSNVLGGALVPQEFLPNLIYLTERVGVARQIANVVRMNRDSLNVPRKTAIVQMQFVGEGSAATPQDNNYDSVTLTARKAMALAQVSNEWLEDSAINVADDYASTFAEAQARLEDTVYFNGTGAGSDGGFVGLTQALPAAAYVSGAAWSSITLANFHALMATVQNIPAGARLSFVCSRQFYHQVMVRLDKQTQQFKSVGGEPSFDQGTFLGFPVYFSQVMQTASGAGRSCYFGAFDLGSMLGDRRDMNIAFSSDRYFDSDISAMRCTARIGVAIHGDGRAGSNGPIAALLGA